MVGVGTGVVMITITMGSNIVLFASRIRFMLYYYYYYYFGYGYYAYDYPVYCIICYCSFIVLCTVFRLLVILYCTLLLCTDYDLLFRTCLYIY